jgi:hypothetical protein
MAWVLAATRRSCPQAALYLEWEPFAQVGEGLLIWEAFVSAAAKGHSDIDDARIAVKAFERALPNPATEVTTDRPLSLAGAAALWSGWVADLGALHTPTLVIRAS